LNADAARRAQPFLLSRKTGYRFCVLHTPPKDRQVHGGCVFVPPFGEERNKSRRMVGMQARALAELGCAVLQIDLDGCGDSSGELREATVPGWIDDVAAAVKWMHAEGWAPLRLWGLRLGALLAARTAVELPRNAVESLLLWQPVLDGKTHLTQFLRIGIAADMTAAAPARAQAGPRERLRCGETVEIAGYEITPAFARELDELRMPAAEVAGMPADWFEISATDGVAPPPASARLLAEWRTAGGSVTYHHVVGEAFWSTVEITDCPQLVQRTTEAVTERWRSPTQSNR
jgi:exosortase A-associated hydrolase 2